MKLALKILTFRCFLCPLMALTICCPALARAAAPGVAFYPPALNFGQVPDSERPTQLLTVVFRRSMFPADHLPDLREEWGASGSQITVFSRYDGPTTIRVVYRVTLRGFGNTGPINYPITLIRDKAVSKEDDAKVAVEDAGVTIKGEFVQGLDTDSKAVDFGPVALGKGATKSFAVGVFRSNFVSSNEITRRRTKPSSGAPPTSPNLTNMTVTSSSPYITLPKKREIGLNGSSWQDWQIVLSPITPAGYLNAELVFHTDNGYSLTVPVRAEVQESIAAEPVPSLKH